MPRNAIAADVVDFVLAPQSIAQELTALARQPAPRSMAEKMFDDSATLDAILGRVRRKSGVDSRLYKRATIYRRLARWR
jgi:two-component system, chemotaxis family, CheB/CheR fusion protein